MPAAKEIALILLQQAVRLLPELGSLLADFLQSASAPDTPLVEELRAVLPVEGESAAVARELGGGP